MSEETVQTIVLTETLMRKRFLKFVSDIEKSLVSTLNSYAGTDKNTRFLHKNRDQPVTCRFVDEHGVNLPFCLFFTPEDNYLGYPSVYYPVGESPTYRPREKICDFHTGYTPGETLTVQALSELVKEYLESKNRKDILDLPGKGTTSGHVTFFEFIEYKEMKEWGEAPVTGSIKNPEAYSVFSRGEDAIVYNETFNDTTVNYAGSTKSQVKFKILNSGYDFWNSEANMFVSKKYLKMLTKKDFIERVDMVVCQSCETKRPGGFELAFRSLSILEEYAGKPLPLAVLRKAADIYFETYGRFFIIKDYEKRGFSLGLVSIKNRSRGHGYSTTIVARNQNNDIRSLVGALLLSDVDSFVKNLQRSNSREER